MFATSFENLFINIFFKIFENCNIKIILMIIIGIRDKAKFDEISLFFNFIILLLTIINLLKIIFRNFFIVKQL